LVQASSSLSMICARAWPTEATRQRNALPPFSRDIDNRKEGFVTKSQLDF